MNRYVNLSNPVTTKEYVQQAVLIAGTEADAIPGESFVNAIGPALVRKPTLGDATDRHARGVFNRRQALGIDPLTNQVTLRRYR